MCLINTPAACYTLFEVSAMKIYETLVKLRQESGLLQSQVAEYLAGQGVAASQRSISNWECGRTQPNADQFLLLCELYGIRDVQEIFLGLPSSSAALNARGRHRVEEYIRLLRADGEFSDSAAVPRRPRAARSIPLYDLPVSAGTGHFLDRDDYELIDADDTVPLSATFAVRISGDSMTPRFVDRQTVYVHQQQTLMPGDTGVFLLNGDVYCKQLEGSGKAVSLVSLNASYAPIDVSEYDELRVVGKVVG